MAKISLFKLLGGKSRLVLIWALICLICGFGWIKQRVFPDSSFSDLSSDLNIFAESILPIGLIALVLFAIGLCVFWIVSFWRERSREIKQAGYPDSQLGAFALRPWEKNRQVVRVYGQVFKVFSNKKRERLKRKAVDVYRTILRNDDPKGRYLHQRFLLSSSYLKDGELLFVVHALSAGKKDLKPGAWVDVQGEYIHRTVASRDAEGKQKESFYGVLHFTHLPKGHLRVYSERGDTHR